MVNGTQIAFYLLAVTDATSFDDIDTFAFCYLGRILDLGNTLFATSFAQQYTRCARMSHDMPADRLAIGACKHGCCARIRLHSVALVRANAVDDAY